MILGALALSFLPGAAFAQDAPPMPAVQIAPAGAELRALDRISGALADIHVDPGQTLRHWGLEITLGECRYPTEDPTSDAFAWLTIREPQQAPALFEGWMIASSPALMALDHPRYDVWVIRCSIAAGDTSGG